MQSADSEGPFCNGCDLNCRCNGCYFGEAKSKQSQNSRRGNTSAESLGAFVPCGTTKPYACRPNAIKGRIAGVRVSLKLHWTRITLLPQLSVLFEVHGPASAMLDRYTQLEPFVNTHLKFGLSNHVLDGTSLVESNGSLNARVRSEAHQYIRAFI